MPIKITREEYQRKFGVTPESTSSSQVVQPKLQTPLLTKSSGGFGTALKDVTVGAGKSLIGGAIGTAGLLQKGGKAVMGAFGADTSNLGFKSLDSNTQEGKGVEETLKAKSRGEQVGKVLGTVGELATGFTVAKGPQAITKAKQVYTAGKEAKASEKVLESLSPKPTMKQAQIAQKEGRLIEGKSPTLFKGGTADKIAPTEKIKNATQTIMQKIPNAQKLKPTELYTAVDTEITKTAEALRPQMKATPIKPETIQRINDDWTNLKKIQMESADATEEANVLKLQKQFEAKLQKSGSDTHDDLWQTRIDYDNSIPENVKKANSLSSASLQNKKEIWLQNREILNSAIKDIPHGMGEVASKQFEEMTNLYEAKTNLLSKAKVNKEKMSKINQVLADNPKVASALGGVTVYQILKNLGIPLP